MLSVCTILTYAVDPKHALLIEVLLIFVEVGSGTELEVGVVGVLDDVLEVLGTDTADVVIKVDESKVLDEITGVDTLDVVDDGTLEDDVGEKEVLGNAVELVLHDVVEVLLDDVEEKLGSKVLDVVTLELGAMVDVVDVDDDDVVSSGGHENTASSEVTYTLCVV